MKIQVIGDGAAARTLRAHLAILGYRLVERGAECVVRMESRQQPGVAIGGGSEALRASAMRLTAELAAGPVTALETGLPEELHVAADAAHTDAAVRGVLRAVLRWSGHGVKQGWLQKYFLGRMK